MAVARPGTSVLELGGFLTPILPAGTTGVQVAVSVTLARTLDQLRSIARTLNWSSRLARTLKAKN